MQQPPRNRITRHVRARAGDLVPHEMNARVHGDAQRSALLALYDEIGFARSLLAYELPDGRLKLIDGHLRASLDPEHEVEVEVLDVNDAEARTLLLAIDPLAQLAGYDAQLLAELRAAAEKDSPAVRALWESLEQDNEQARRELESARDASLDEQYLILVECESEQRQIELLERFQSDGIPCKALMS